MNSKRGHVLKSDMLRHVDSQIPFVITALNGDREEWNSFYDPAPLLTLVKSFQELEKVWSQPEKSYWKRGERHVPSNALREPWDTIDNVLHGYTARPSLMLMHQSEPAHDSMEVWDVQWFRVDKVPHHELAFALQIVEIFRAGKINLLKQCDQCERWLCARFPHQRFCSEECREQFHSSNEADKKRRRDWARANYQSRKELELGSRKAAQRKGGKR